MARGPSTRVVLNRSRFEELALAIADGLGDWARGVIESANPPDAAPFGEGLVTRGGVLVYIGDKKVGGWGTDGRQPKKPRAFRVKGTTAIHVVAGFGFPAMFQEFGTINHGAQPFLTPALSAGMSAVGRTVAVSVKARGF